MELVFIGVGFFMLGASGWGICAAINRFFFRFEKSSVELQGALLFFLTILILQIGLAVLSLSPKINATVLAEGLPGVGFAYLFFRLKSPLKSISIAFVINALIYSVGLAIFGYWGVLNYLMNTLKWSVLGFAAMFSVWVIFGMKSLSTSQADRGELAKGDQDDRTKPVTRNWTE